MLKSIEQMEQPTPQNHIAPGDTQQKCYECVYFNTGAVYRPSDLACSPEPTISQHWMQEIHTSLPEKRYKRAIYQLSKRYKVPLGRYYNECKHFKPAEIETVTSIINRYIKLYVEPQVDLNSRERARLINRIIEISCIVPISILAATIIALAATLVIQPAIESIFLVENTEDADNSGHTN